MQRELPVFPGAEGFGTRTPAGRGGKVIEVTSLADSGPGSLRDALMHEGRRIIVFRCSGTIVLKSLLFISHPYVTLAGQTASGDGICLKDFGVVVLTHDVLIQHVRVRPGNQGDIRPDHNDAISILGEHGDVEGGAHHVVIDHVSASWGEDETISTWYGPSDITISWCIIGEALDRSRHRKGTHSAGLLVGDGSERVSMHHNLLAHNSFRNPLIIGGGTHGFVNNVVYNWKNIPGEIVDYRSNTFLDFIGNYYRRGPSNVCMGRELITSPGRGKGTPKIYVKGNIGPYRATDSMDEWESVGYGWGARLADRRCQAIAPFGTGVTTVTSAVRALGDVLAGAGATIPRRDAVDDRIVTDVQAVKGKIIDSPQEVGGHPRLVSTAPPIDSDHDGMPDAWEKENGLDPGSPNDGTMDQDQDGYTNTEEYLHSLTSRVVGAEESLDSR